MQTQEEGTHFKERGRGGIRTGGQHTDNIEGMFIITWLDAKLSSSTCYDKKNSMYFLRSPTLEFTYWIWRACVFPESWCMFFIF